MVVVIQACECLQSAPLYVCQSFLLLDRGLQGSHFVTCWHEWGMLVCPMEFPGICHWSQGNSVWVMLVHVLNREGGIRCGLPVMFAQQMIRRTLYILLSQKGPAEIALQAQAHQVQRLYIWDTV